MESLCRSPLSPNKPLLSSRPVVFSKTPLLLLSPFPSKPPPLPLRASHRSPAPSPKTLDPFLSLLRPVAALAVAAFLLARFPNHPRAAAAAAATAAVSFSPSTTVHAETFPSSSSSSSSSFSSSSSESSALVDPEKERLLEERLASHPDDADALRALMELKIKAGKLPDAIAIVDRLILLDPSDADLPLLKYHLYCSNGDAAVARRGFEELLEKDPLLVEAYHGLILASSQSGNPEELDLIAKRIEGAMEACKKEKRKDDLRDFKLLTAQIKVIQGKYEDSLKIYGDLAREEPSDFRPYLCQGIVYSLLMKKDEAEKQFEKYRRLVPKGHPYGRFFDDGMIAMKVFGQIEENRRKDALKS
ncbi:protein SLOW GREEN 1, chloroplastic-like [Ananas comosus]|uniref:Protein SLOW GREEN 1, chloroplastic-like n=1 Tax=Ananas comosus TaxID=4615 RepID=A0A6P5GQB2_ANACO|nr:protein SLOW GREEN 1, chloroplastic-like [Ananas comosus]